LELVKRVKIVSVVGARPNFMKIAPLIRAIERHNEGLVVNDSRHLDHLLVHTGQHYDYEMSQVFFQDLEIPVPDFHLNVGSGTHAGQTGKIMIEFEQLALQENPDLVVVVGDVNSTLAAALAAAKIHIPVAHIEAGLRSFDRTMPEEINRLLTDVISDYLFTHSPEANENLRREGILGEKIFLVGNVMADSLIYNMARAEKSGILRELDMAGSDKSPAAPYALLTLHRPGNVDNRDNLAGIVEALEEVSRRVAILFPCHPRTLKKLKEFNLLESPPFSSGAIRIIAPTGYIDFLHLEMNASFVMTDSGGVQEETTFMGIPCLTLRNTTEWSITLTRGTNTLVQNNAGKIIEEASRIIDGKGKRGSRPELWDGRTAERIVEIIAGKE
jgi:UDP-N-acetylglucosamine 2-epimerase (non-hydrolysing)